MLNQFHDVLPGTTISLVVKDVLEIYAKRTKQADELIAKAMSMLGFEPLEADTIATKDLLALDPLRMNRKRVLELDGDPQLYTFDSTGVGRLQSVQSKATTPRAYVQNGGHVLENRDFKITIANGRITSLVDLALEREMISPGQGTSTGGLMIYEDYPLQYDAWDVEVYHLNTGREISFTSIETIQGSTRSSLKATAAFGKSKVVMTVRHNAHVDTDAKL